MKKKKTVKRLKNKIAILESENMLLQGNVLRAENTSREKSAFVTIREGVKTEEELLPNFVDTNLRNIL